MSVLDDMIGPVGTPRRDRMDRDMRRMLRAERIASIALRPLTITPLGRPTALLLWYLFIDTAHSRPTPRGLLDAFSFQYFGDFLFWGKPMTVAYHRSWVSRVHLPRRVRTTARRVIR